ncbi:MAG: hypothetical protein WCA92_04295 [Terriglobales bacterium]|jgi:hypothetical protein
MALAAVVFRILLDSSKRISAISFAAVPYGENFDGVAGVMEADAIIPNPEAEFRGFDAMKPLDIPFAAREDAGQSVKNAEGRILVNRAEVGFSPLAPDNFL